MLLSLVLGCIIALLLLTPFGVILNKTVKSNVQNVEACWDAAWLFHRARAAAAADSLSDHPGHMMVEHNVPHKEACLAAS